MRIVFFGTPRFAATILEALLEEKFEVCAVVTKPDKRQGRSSALQPPAVKKSALAHHLPLYQPLKASDPEFAKTLEALGADLFVVAAYSEIFKENLLKMPPLACINVHASLLPKYRGAAPIQRALMEGERETGVTIMAMARELDAGGILATAKIPIEEGWTAGELTEHLAQLGAKSLVHVLHKLLRGEKLLPQPQDSARATYAPKLKPEDGEIHWKRPAEEIVNQIRGVTPKPGAWCLVRTGDKVRRLLIKKAKLDPTFKAPPGSWEKSEEALVVGTPQGGVALLELQLEGKSVLPAALFLRGISPSSFAFLI